MESQTSDNASKRAMLAVSPYNQVALPKLPEGRGPIQIFDTTLRDGEQAPGIALSAEEKVRIAAALDDLGVDYIEAGFAVSSDIERKTIREIVDAGPHATVVSLARSVRKDIDLRPVEGVNGRNTDEEILEKLAKFGITPKAVILWGTGKPLREFLWSEEMADASVHVLLNVDFKDTYKEGDKEIRNCHINVGTGKELSIKELAEKIVREIGFKGELRWDATKPDGTMRKLTDVTKLHNLGWHHKVEIDEGIHRLYEWYLKGICINHQ